VDYSWKQRNNFINESRLVCADFSQESRIVTLIPDIIAPCND